MRVLVAGGGTGGHLFPGIALAEEVVTRHPQNDAIFVGTNRGLEARVVPANGFVFEAIPSRGLKGMGLVKLVLGLLTIPLSFLSALRLLMRYRPDVVVGVGGYSSGPVVMAAWVLRVPTAIQEQNALPGLTNRILGRFVDVVFLTFENTRSFFPRARCEVMGNPIRKKLMDNFLQPKTTAEKFRLLIFGGSLGAKGLNQRVLDSLPFLEDLKGSLQVLHQTGKADVAEVRAAYESKHFKATVTDFIDDMSAAYADSDLVICRSGATTIAELTVCKKASILVPFPKATDDHQAVNARALVDARAALMFRESELTGEILAKVIRELINDRPRLNAMEEAASALGHPSAAQDMAEVLVALTTRKWGNKGRAREGKPLRPEVKPT